MLRPSSLLRLPRASMRVWRPLQLVRDPVDREERDRLRQAVLNLNVEDTNEPLLPMVEERSLHSVRRIEANVEQIAAFLNEHGAPPQIHTHTTAHTPFKHQIVAMVAVGRGRRALAMHLQAALKGSSPRIDFRDEDWLVLALTEDLCVHLLSPEAHVQYSLMERWQEQDQRDLSLSPLPPPRKALKAGRAAQ